VIVLIMQNGFTTQRTTSSLLDQRQ
jgi:hypothetical protein